MVEKELEDCRWKYMSLDWYKEPKNKNDWLACSECGLTPRIWEFDNGRYANCVCGIDVWNNKHQVKAKSIMYLPHLSYHHNTLKALFQTLIVYK